MQIELDADVFRAWLEQNVERMVGWTCSDKLTPVAEWLMGQYGAEFFVTDESIVMGFFDVCIATPGWVSQFVHALDAHSDGQEEPVMGRVALSLFDETYQG